MDNAESEYNKNFTRAIESYSSNDLTKINSGIRYWPILNFIKDKFFP